MSGAIDKLLALMQRLRDPQSGCPWDRQQTPASLVKHTLEEAFEVAECIEQARWDELPGELGDLLFQIVFYAQIACEKGSFTFDDIALGITEKLIRRHPHVFGHEPVLDAARQAARWESIKAAERLASSRGEQASLLGDVPHALPALSRAVKLQARAARVGFDWTTPAPVFEKLQEEVDEVHEALAASDPTALDHEVGDLLFTCANLARHLGVDAEGALRRASLRFEARFAAMALAAGSQALDLAALSPAQWDALWEAAKRTEKKRVP